MSYSLYWRPISTKKNNAGKDQALKWAMQKKFGSPINRTIGESNIEYLQGLKDAGVDGASDLIDAVEKCGSIELFEE